jgi:hypothetical protein
MYVSPAGRRTGPGRPAPGRLAAKGGRHVVHLPRVPPPQRRTGSGGPRSARAARRVRLPGALGGADPAHQARELDVLPARRDRRAARLDVGSVPGAAARDHHEGHPLRHLLDEARHELGRRLGRHVARRRRDEWRVRRRVLRRRLYDEPPARGRDRRQGLDRVRLRRRAARGGARRAGAAARAAPVFLEEREMGARAASAATRRAGLLGGLRLPQLRDPWLEQRYRGD